MIKILKEKWDDLKFVIKIARYNQPMEINIAILLIIPGTICYYLLLSSLTYNWPDISIIFLKIVTFIYFIFLLIGFIEGYILRKRINKFYTSIPTLFFYKYCFLNLKKPKRKTKKTQCPKLISLLNMRTLKLREDKIYIACTHDDIIKFLKKNKRYNVEFIEEPKLLATKSLHRVVKTLKNKKCKQCENDYKNKEIDNSKVCDWIKKEERNFYGIKFKVSEKM